eukprot:scaffold11945_cov60-Cylindrotheca_fusiformis.AAC.3
MEDDTSDGNDSDVSGNDSVAASLKRSRTSQRSANTSSSKKKKKNRKTARTTYSLIDDSTTAAIADANEAANIRMQEMARHNKVMEAIESDKAKSIRNELVDLILSSLIQGPTDCTFSNGRARLSKIVKTLLDFLCWVDGLRGKNAIADLPIHFLKQKMLEVCAADPQYTPRYGI